MGIHNQWVQLEVQGAEECVTQSDNKGRVYGLVGRPQVLNFVFYFQIVVNF